MFLGYGGRFLRKRNREQGAEGGHGCRRRRRKRERFAGQRRRRTLKRLKNPGIFRRLRCSAAGIRAICSGGGFRSVSERERLARTCASGRLEGEARTGLGGFFNLVSCANSEI